MTANKGTGKRLWLTERLLRSFSYAYAGWEFYACGHSHPQCYKKSFEGCD